MLTVARPKWIESLTNATTFEEWTSAILNVDDAAIEGLLRRHALPVASLRSERMQSVREAFDTSAIGLADLEAWRDDIYRVIDAIESIGVFRQRWQLVDEFRAEHGFSPAKMEAILAEIRAAIFRGNLPLESWVHHLDPHREEADREIFLYRLSPSCLTALQSWRVSGQLSTWLSERGLGEVSATPRFVWLPLDPEVVAASYDAGQDLIRLQWVSGRDDPGTCCGRRRCLTFIRIDLTSGNVELQLQHLEHGGLRSLVAERDRFVRVLHDLLGESPAPMQLEPAMRVLMTDARLAMDSWRVRLPTGGVLAGKRQGDLFDKVRSAFDRYYALELAGEWKQSETVSLSVRFDARGDLLAIRQQCSTSTLACLVALLREHGVLSTATESEGRRPPVDLPRPDISADDLRLAALRTTIEKLVTYFRRLGHLDIAVDHLASQAATNDLLVNAATVQEALTAVGVKSVGAVLYIVCPRTLTPVQRSGQTVEYERLDLVPAEIECENHDGVITRHMTKGNVWLRVGHHPSSPPAPPSVPAAMLWAGYACGVGALLFFALLTLLPTFGYPLTCQQRFPAIVVLALASALAAGFLGGTASASSRLSLTRRLSPLTVGVTGGVAVLVIILLIGYLLWARPCDGG